MAWVAWITVIDICCELEAPCSVAAATVSIVWMISPIEIDISFELVAKYRPSWQQIQHHSGILYLFEPLSHSRV